MTTLLQRVSEAREKATVQFMKDLAIHEMAMIIKDVYPDLVKIMVSDARLKGRSPIASDLNALVGKLLSVDMQRVISSPSASESDLKRVGGFELIEVAKKACAKAVSASRYDRVVDHIRGFRQLIDACPLDAKSCSVDQHEKTVRVLKQFESIIPRSIDRAENMYTRAQMPYKPTILTFQGGGAKGLGYVGVHQALDDMGMINNLKYIAGTSAGALIAMPIALGFHADELTAIVRNGQFAQFFSESTRLFKMMTMPGLMWDRFRGKVDPAERPYLEGFNLSEFARGFMLPAIVEATGANPKDLLRATDVELDEFLRKHDKQLDGIYHGAMFDYEEKLVRSNRVSEIDVLKFSELPGRSEAMQACATSIRSLRKDKHPQSDLIESYLSDLIEIALRRYFESNPQSPLAKEFDSQEKRRNITFNQLQLLAEATGYTQFKELGVAMTQSHMMTMSWFPRAYKNTIQSIRSLMGKDPVDDKGYGTFDNSTNFQPLFARAGGGEYIDMPIKTAVRASMNLPVIFETMTHDGKKLIDGGMNSNYPHRMFLDKYDGDVTLAEKNSIGFMLSTIDSDMEMLAIDEMARVAKKQLAVELDKYPDTTLEKFKGASRETIEFLGVLGINILTLKPAKAFNQIKSLLTAPITLGMGWMVNSVMDRNNAALPSETILDNTGILNAGMVTTEDFHLNPDQKDVLIRAGKKAALSLMSDHSDRHLRFSKDRLVSLINIENELSDQLGKDNSITLPPLAMNDPYQLAKALKKAYAENFDLGQMLSGTMPELIDQGKFTENLPISILHDDPIAVHYDELKMGRS